jgi:tRNA nucleotidyltransferase/poly(A) polymerase
VLRVLERLAAAGYRGWIVGGALRDQLLGRPPLDWDVATTASPEEVARLFPRVIPVGLRHGTVVVHLDTLDIQVTTCPPAASAELAILNDLKRRDFTINGLALSYPEGKLLDPHAGQSDLAASRLRAVGDAAGRFREDPLRTLRALRFVSTYGMHVTRSTLAALMAEAHGLAQVAWERIRDEMVKLLLGPAVLDAFVLLRRCGILGLVLPELLEGVRKKQDRHHHLDIYHHALHTVHHSPVRARVRLAALLHDIAKPRVRRRIRGSYRFYGHASASAAMAAAVLERWKLPAREIDRVATLVRHHMLLEVDRWSDAAVRRLMERVPPELLDDLLDLAAADRLAHAPGADGPAEIERLRQRIALERERPAALHVRDLAVSGHDVMHFLGLAPGPAVGQVLRALQRKVLADPALNRRDALLELLRGELRGEPAATGAP